MHNHMQASFSVFHSTPALARQRRSRNDGELLVIHQSITTGWLEQERLCYINSHIMGVRWEEPTEAGTEIGVKLNTKKFSSLTMTFCLETMEKQ